MYPKPTPGFVSKGNPQVSGVHKFGFDSPKNTHPSGGVAGFRAPSIAGLLGCPLPHSAPQRPRGRCKQGPRKIGGPCRTPLNLFVILSNGAPKTSDVFTGPRKWKIEPLLICMMVSHEYSESAPQDPGLAFAKVLRLFERLFPKTSVVVGCLSVACLGLSDRERKTEIHLGEVRYLDSLPNGPSPESNSSPTSSRNKSKRWLVVN